MRLKNYSKETRQFKKRIAVAAITMGILLGVIIFRLFNLQIWNYGRFAKLATDNQLDYIAIVPNRGLIYDRNGVLVAENIPAFTLNIIMEHIKNMDDTIGELKKIIDITPRDLKQFYKHLKNHRHLEHIPLKQKLTPEEVAKFYINKYKFVGVTIDTAMYRHYPLGEDLAHVVGYVGKANQDDLKNIDANNYTRNDFLGKVGIEKYYESLLHGKIGYKVVEIGATGKIVRPIKIIHPVPGSTIHLTIDSNLQRIAKRAFGEEKGAAVALDPRNGEILVLVSNPSYNPNLFAQGIDSTTFNGIQNSPRKPLYNRATKGQFPFASTIKPFLAIQALDSQTIDANFKIQDPGWFKLENSTHIYHDWKSSGHGVVNLAKAIMVSCDIFFYILATKLGIGNITNVLEKFGFGSKTQIDLPEEAPGIVASPRWKMQHLGRRWYTGDTVISAIGQGSMATTPLQLAQGTAAIALRGKRFKPHLLKSTQSPDGTVEETKPTALATIELKDPKIWNLVIGAMGEVITNPQGTAYHRFDAQNLPYSVAGKTGEAQLYRSQTKNRQDTPKHLLNHNLFIAFAPIDDPQIVVAVITENSNLAVRATRKILDHFFNYSPRKLAVAN